MNLDQPKLNSTEVWIAEHSIRIFLGVAAAIVLGAVAVVVVFSKQGATEGTVNKVLKPQVTNISRALCDGRTLKDAKRAKLCAERIRYGLVNCRRSPACRAALLAAVASPTVARGATSGATHGSERSLGAPGDAEGGGAQQPSSHGPQQHGPGSQPGQQPEAAPTPSSSPGAEPSSAPETPANGQQGAPDGGSASGAGVEVCAVKTCVGAEVHVPGL